MTRYRFDCIIPAALRSVLFSLLIAGCLSACGRNTDDMLASAKSYLATDDVNAAVIQLKNVLQADPQQAEARYLLGMIHYQRENYLSAAKELAHARKLGYDKAPVVPFLASAWARSGQGAKVIEQFANGLPPEETNIDGKKQALLHTALGEAYLSASDYQQAEKSLNRALQLDDANALTYLDRARLSLHRQQAQTALEEVNRALQLRDDQPQAYALRADALLQLNRAEEAIRDLQQAVTRAPRVISYHYDLISVLLLQNKIDLAEEELADVQQVAPEHASVRYLAAFIDSRRNRLASAQAHLQEVLRQSPDNISAHLLAGEVAMRRNEQIKAQRHLEAVLAKMPQNQFARRLLAQSFLISGQLSRAKSLSERLLHSAPDNSDSLRLAGEIAAAEGDFSSAADYFSKALALRSDDETRTRLAVASFSLGKETEALKMLERLSLSSQNAADADFALVMLQLKKGQYQEALRAQQVLEKKRPDDPQVFNLKGGIFLAQQQLDKARLAFKKALSVAPGFLPATVNLVRIDRIENKLAQAESHFERAIKADPNNADAYLLLANLKMELNQPDAMIRTTLERASKANPKAIEPKLAMIEYLLAREESAQALAIAQQQAALHHDDTRVLFLLGRTQVAQGQLQQAINSFERVADLQPYAIDPLLALADTHYLNRDTHHALQTLERVMALQADALEAQLRWVAWHNAQGQYPQALREARKVQRQRPARAVGFVLEGDVWVAQQKWSDALNAFNKAMTLDASPELAIKLYSVMRQNESADAVQTKQFAAQWLEKHPDDLLFMAHLAEEALNEQRYPQAEKLYRRMCKQVPDNVIVLNNLAWVAGQLKRDDALALAQQAAKLAPDSPTVLDTLGMLQVDHGDVNAGLKNMQRAVELVPDNLSFKLNLVRAYHMSGQSTQARQMLQRTLEGLEPDNPHYPVAMELQQMLTQRNGS